MARSSLNGDHSDPRSIIGNSFRIRNPDLTEASTSQSTTSTLLLDVRDSNLLNDGFRCSDGFGYASSSVIRRRTLHYDLGHVQGVWLGGLVF